MDTLTDTTTDLDVYYMEDDHIRMSDLVGLTIVRQVSSPAGAMVTVRGTYTALCRFVTAMYDECEQDDILVALPNGPLDAHVEFIL